MTITAIGSHKVAAGTLTRYQHTASTLHCEMQFSVFLPPSQSADNPPPVLYWLSGLTCTDENFTQKAGAFRAAAELGLAIVCCDTSPRGDDVPDDPDNAYDFGLGAGFYVNASQAPWNQHYQMYDYITHELPSVVEANLAVSAKRSIAGHSMGGHGALVAGLRNSDRYASISAFAPIVNPSQCLWGKKAFSQYLGDDKTQWQAYDACALIRASAGSSVPEILIDQGTADQFLEEQLLTQHFVDALADAGHSANVRFQHGYDHSYYFIQTFIDEHLAFHAHALGLSRYPFEL